jgi:hypothetical protein
MIAIAALKVELHDDGRFKGVRDVTTGRWLEIPTHTDTALDAGTGAATPSVSDMLSSEDGAPPVAAVPLSCAHCKGPVGWCKAGGRCADCQQVAYCTPLCHYDHWAAVHRSVCAPMQKQV